MLERALSGAVAVEDENQGYPSSSLQDNLGIARQRALVMGLGPRKLPEVQV